MSDLLYRLNIETGVPVWGDDAEKLDGIFAAALLTPATDISLCPFCGDGRAERHEHGVLRCADCETVWINDSDYQRLTEKPETVATRLALIYQQAHSEPLFDMTYCSDNERRRIA